MFSLLRSVFRSTFHISMTQYQVLYGGSMLHSGTQLWRFTCLGERGNRSRDQILYTNCRGSPTLPGARLWYLYPDLSPHWLAALPVAGARLVGGRGGAWVPRVLKGKKVHQSSEDGAQDDSCGPAWPRPARHQATPLHLSLTNNWDRIRGHKCA